MFIRYDSFIPEAYMESAITYIRDIFMHQGWVRGSYVCHICVLHSFIPLRRIWKALSPTSVTQSCVRYRFVAHPYVRYEFVAHQYVRYGFVAHQYVGYGFVAHRYVGYEFVTSACQTHRMASLSGLFPEIIHQ